MDVLDFPVYPDYDDDDDEFNSEAYEYIDVQDHAEYDIPFGELLNTCVFPVFKQGLSDVAVVLLCCFAVGSVHYIVPERCSWRRHVLNLCAVGSGLYSLYSIFKEDCWTLIVVGFAGFILLGLNNVGVFQRLRGSVVVVVAVAYVLLYELKFGTPVVVHKIRGAQMIIFMKILSLSNLDKLSTPDILEYCGYIFAPGTVVFGPWISLDDYRLWATKNSARTLKDIVRNIFQFCQSFCLSFACLSFSTCLITWIYPFTINKWMGAYRTAAMFRFSHYFICYLSECALLGMGIFGVPVVQLLKIEKPRSLVEVVEFWNIPMRNWLKRHVFLNARKVLGVPAALVITYAASSLLHGLNFQLSAVLLSLALFTYAEHQLRQQLSEIYDACIRARPCKGCEHKNAPRSPLVLTTNIVFGLVAVFQLAYLGMMFDSSSAQEEGYEYQHTLSKWSALGFAGHYIALFMLVTQYLLR